ncbi:tight junction protein ZO-3 isoform X2 [Clupea harengus]|nr:tight junction protein ZO-3 isoform X2 [Clupea harengus]XP_031430615.1 tight junction protein ZO-3 isoform X2 [Clupea harengus]XP_031430616.1 tight junction protein ZO-3 isoform X2 [Clupea harengus]
MEEMTIWEQHTVTLSKDPKMGFGFALSGGRDKPNPDTGDTAVVVSDVVRNGPAMGVLHTRDRIVMVNGVSMENGTSNFTIQNLKSCGKTANVTVKRPKVIQIPITTRPTRAQSSSNLLAEDPNHRRPRRGSDTGSYGRDPRRGRSASPERNGHDLALMSGFKRLPQQDAADKPIRTTLIKKKQTDEYGMKLGSQIFIKHMTPTGLAAKEGTLQEGDLVLKINGMTTENLSLLETKHLVEKSRGRLTMVVLRDSRKFLVSIPEVEDSPRNSGDERHGDSSELEDISDLDSDSPARGRSSRPPARERRTHRTRAEAPPPKPKSRDPSPVRTTLNRPPAHSLPRRRAPSESESDRSDSPPPPRRDSPDTRDSDRYRVLSGISTLPNPRDSPNWNAPRPSSSASRPRKPVSESDSDRGSSPPARRKSPKTDSHARYKVLPDLPANLRANSRGSSPFRPPPPDSESESDGSTSRRTQDSRYRKPPGVAKAPAVEPPRWTAPTVPKPTTDRGPSDTESEASYAPAPRPESPINRGSLRAIGGLPEMRSSPVVVRQEDSLRRVLPPARPPPEDSSESERAPSPPRRYESTDESNHSFPRANGTLRSDVSKASNSKPQVKAIEEPVYALPPDAFPTYNQGYSSDQNVVDFVKDGSVGLRLVGGNDVGIFVGGVQPNSPAQRQGMKEGDQIMQVNGVDFNHFTREEAAMYLLNVRTGEPISLRTQNKMDIYKKIMKSNIGDSFYIRTHFDHEAEGNVGLSFTRGEVFRVLDTMHRGKLGNWLAVRMGHDLHELDKGTIPNQTRAETLASTEQAQRVLAAEKQASGQRAEFWKMRGLRGAKKNTRRTRDDLLMLTIQGKFPAYEKVLLREANFKRPIVILGPLNDIAMEKLAREMPDEFQVADMVPRSGAERTSSTVIKLDTVRKIAEQNKHPLLDITPTAVERLNYIQYHPMVFFLDPHSRKDVKTMRQRYAPDSNKSSRRLYASATKVRKHYSHLFSAHIDLQPGSHVWYEALKDKIRQQQAKPVWVSEVTLEGGETEVLDELAPDHASDYLSCDSRAASDYEDTDGEAYTDGELGELYTDNEDIDDPFSPPEDVARHSRSRGTALARSSEPARDRDSPSPSPSPEPHHSLAPAPEAEPVYQLPPDGLPPILYVPKPQSQLPPSYSPPRQDAPSPRSRSFSDSDYSATEIQVPTTPSDGPPDFQAPDPRPKGAEPPPESPPPPPVTLSFIEEKLQQTRMAEPGERQSPQFLVLAHHEALHSRRTQINGSDSSEDQDDFDDNEWGSATEL